MVSVRCCDPSFKITFLAAPHALDFEDEQKIGGRDAVSSSSAVVSDRLGSLSYHKPDHPTLNAAAALGPPQPRQLPCCCAGTERADEAI